MQLLFRRGKRGQVLHQRALVGRQRAAAFPGGEDGIGALESDLAQSGDAFVCRVDAKSRLGLFQQRRIFQRLLFFLGQRLVRLTGPGNGIGVGSVSGEGGYQPFRLGGFAAPAPGKRAAQQHQAQGRDQDFSADNIHKVFTLFRIRIYLRPGVGQVRTGRPLSERR